MKRIEDLVDDKKFRRAVGEVETVKELSKLFPFFSYETVRRAHKIVTTGIDPKYGNNDIGHGAEVESVKRVCRGDIETIDITSPISSVEGLLERFNYDKDIWSVVESNVGVWQSAVKDEDGRITKPTLYKINAKVKQDIEKAKIKFALTDMLEAIKDHSPIVPQRDYKDCGDSLFEVSIFDLHLGKLCWGEETGESYDTETACELFRNALDFTLCHSEQFKPARFLLPIGNDFFHIDNSKATTTAGTPQDTDKQWKEIFTIGRKLIIESIDRLSRIAPVDVVIVPGNHDAESIWHLGVALECWYHNDANVNIDNSAKTRKIYTYGNTVLGFTHGNGEKVKDLPLIFQTEFPLEWGMAKFREIHHGHYHSAKTTLSVPVSEQYGTKVRQLPSLSAADAWHYSKGYIGSRAAETFIISPEKGIIATLTYSP